eukprot:scaffold24_cov341-Pavlova_lutheri.AAC.105
MVDWHLDTIIATALLRLVVVNMIVVACHLDISAIRHNHDQVFLFLKWNYGWYACMERLGCRQPLQKAGDLVH